MSQGRHRGQRALALATLFFSGCGGSLGSGRLDLAVKYISYRGPNSSAVVTSSEAQGNVAGVNKLWSPCGIQFRLEAYEAVDPPSLDLSFDPRDLSELAGIRTTFSVPNELLLVTTGPWDRTGTLGTSPASAWTAMPAPSGPFGTVIEASVGDFSTLIAHELGHYLGLSHVTDEADVMHAIIYSSSRNLTLDQCQLARSTIAAYWQPALR